MRLPRYLYEEMVRHALDAWPNEACGILGGKGETARVFRGLANVADNPERRYMIAPADLLRTMRDLDENGLDLLAIFHSHPVTPAYPSATDISLAQYPDALYLILSLADRNDPVLRAFHIIGAEVSEAVLFIDDALLFPV